jgi:hypothetical protein
MFIGMKATPTAYAEADTALESGALDTDERPIDDECADKMRNTGRRLDTDPLGWTSAQDLRTKREDRQTQGPRGRSLQTPPRWYVDGKNSRL